MEIVARSAEAVALARVDEGEHDAAKAAARAGMRVAPGDRRLYLILRRVRSVHDPAAVERIDREYARIAGEKLPTGED